METKQYREEIKRTMNKTLPDKEKLAMLGMGLAGEVGEVVDNLKKHVYHGHELDIEDTTKELGDVCWYLFNLMNELGIDEKVVFEKNIQKLQKRYKKGFSEADSINRVDS